MLNGPGLTQTSGTAPFLDVLALGPNSYREKVILTESLYVHVPLAPAVIENSGMAQIVIQNGPNITRRSEIAETVDEKCGMAASITKEMRIGPNFRMAPMLRRGSNWPQS